MSIVNSHCGFQPLEEVCLGDVYPAEYYDHLPSAVKDAFYTITEWTKDDLSKIEKKLQELGVNVVRPVYNSIDDCIDSNGNLLKPVVASRDDTLALGNTLYHLRNKFKTDPWRPDFFPYRGGPKLDWLLDD